MDVDDVPAFPGAREGDDGVRGGTAEGMARSATSGASRGGRKVRLERSRPPARSGRACSRR